jgi:hypothetical protein
MKQDAKYIRWFEEIKIEDVPVVGGKNASLGEMYHSYHCMVRDIKRTHNVVPFTNNVAGHLANKVESIADGWMQ